MWMFVYSVQMGGATRIYKQRLMKAISYLLDLHLVLWILFRHLGSRTRSILQDQGVMRL